MLDTRCLIICPSNQVAISFTFPKILRIAASSFHPSVGSRHELARRTSRKSLGPHTLNNHNSPLSYAGKQKLDDVIHVLLLQGSFPENRRTWRKQQKGQCKGPMQQVDSPQFFTEKSQSLIMAMVWSQLLWADIFNTSWPAKQQMVAAKWSTCPTFGCSECRLAVLKIPATWFTAYVQHLNSYLHAAISCNAIFATSFFRWGMLKDIDIELLLYCRMSEFQD